MSCSICFRRDSRSFWIALPTPLCSSNDAINSRGSGVHSLLFTPLSQAQFGLSICREDLVCQCCERRAHLVYDDCQTLGRDDHVHHSRLARGSRPVLLPSIEASCVSINEKLIEPCDRELQLTERRCIFGVDTLDRLRFGVDRTGVHCWLMSP
jgi:hypothetical protein